ncbi:hypothetical protein KA478_02135 [Patescibacteria group bacterium]|nr:hypothetical protein [Patescibacteria group bacterium]
MNETSIITVTRILDATHTIVGKASKAAVSLVDQSDFFKQRPINGIVVFNGIHTFNPFQPAPYLHVQ